MSAGLVVSCTGTKQGMTHVSSIRRDVSWGGIVGLNVLFVIQTLFTLVGEMCDKVDMLSGSIVFYISDNFPAIYGLSHPCQLYV